MSSEFWDERYRSPEYFYGTAPNDFLKECVSALPSKARVWCVGEGEGRNAVYLAKCGFEVVATDQSAVGLEKAQRLAREAGVRVQSEVLEIGDEQVASGTYPKVASFDLICLIWFHLNSELRRSFHLKLSCEMKVGAWVVLEAYRPEQLAYGTGGPKDPSWLMTEESVKVEFPGIQWTVLRSTVRSVHEGRGHQGESAVVQAFGRKVSN
jgi:hypothetical protein